MEENYVYSHVNILTGGIGSGKSTVSAMLKDLGAETFCADVIAKEVVQPGTEALAKIKKEFGSEIISNGSLDRSKLGAIVFENKQLLDLLEKIIHPAVKQKALSLFEHAIEQKKRPIVYDCPLYFETSLKESRFKSVTCVFSSIEKRIERVMSRDSLSKEEVISRINSQISLERKVSESDFVINNDTSLDELKLEVKRLYAKLGRLR